MNRNITAVILIVLGIGIYVTVTRGVLSDASAVKAVNAQYSSAIANAEQLITLRDKVRSDYNSISEDDRARLDKMIPNTVDNIRLIIDLSSIAARRNLGLRNIKAAVTGGSAASTPATPAAKASTGGIAVPTLDTVAVSFSVTAPYDQFILFLQDLEANLRIMDVTHLTVSAGQGSDYDFSVELRTYWLRQ